MTDSPALLKPPPAWRIWDNPIFLRYTRSRLRMRGLLPWLLLTVIFSAFIYLIVPISSKRIDELKPQEQALMRQNMEMQIRQNPQNRAKIEKAWAGRLAMVSTPLTAEGHVRKSLVWFLAIQAMILFVVGTGQVAGGMTSERDDGMVDYQRLAPMTPLAKTLGYLIGLPVREWVLFGATLPFTGLVLWQGKVPFSDWGPVALVFLTSVILYHLTGLVTGTVLKNRRWAFLLCMGMVFLLYFLAPQGARLGLPFLRYMTMWPALLESTHFLTGEAARGLQIFAAHTPGAGVKFFRDDWVFSDLQFTLLVQGSLILTMLVMVWRRWRQADSHLLSKAWALLVFVWLCILPLGNAIPGIKDGSLFPARTFRRLLRGGDDRPSVAEAIPMCGFYGLLMLLLLTIQVFLLTPSSDTQARGLRRAAKLGRQNAPYFADASSAFAIMLILTACAAGSWGWFTQSVLASPWFNADPGVWIYAAFFAVLAPGVMGLHTLLEARGGKWPFLAIVFLGVVPLLASLVVLASSHQAPTAAVIIGGASPLVQPFYAAEQVVPSVLRGNTATLHDAARVALYIWPALYAAGALQGMMLLRRHWTRLRKTGGAA